MIYDDAQVIEHATVADSVHIEGAATIRGHARLSGAVHVSGYATVGGDVELDGEEQIHADGLVLSADDLFTSRPPGDQFLWTVHRCASGGWKANAGCVRGIDVGGPWDARTAPQARLRNARQAHYAWVQDQCRERDA